MSTPPAFPSITPGLGSPTTTGVRKRRGRPRPGCHSLHHVLTLRIGLITALAAALLVVSSTVAVRQILVAQIDDQLDQSFVRQTTQSGTIQGSNNPDAPRETLANPGTEVGTIIVRQFANGQRAGAVIEDGRPPVITLLGTSVVNEVLAIDAGTTQTVRLAAQNGGSTWYRVTLRQSDDGYWAVGLPMASVDRVTATLAVAASVLGLLVVAASIIVARVTVRRSLRPLNRLATIADAVSHLDLATGEVELTPRLPQSDANEDSEVGRLSRAFNHMLNNIEGALASRQRSEQQVRQFVADASHELRNPLASIRGYAELTHREREQLPPITAHAMARIEAESERMSHLVEDMLLLARLDAGPNVSITDVDAVEIVLNAVDDTRAAATDHHWMLDVAGEVIVRADPHRLHQAVSNLLANGWRHTPPGTTVRTSITTAGPWAQISISDNGPGVPTEVRDHVFERFARAEASRTESKDGSSGLGLAIVASIMQALGGSASMRTGEDGTTFTLFVPLAAPTGTPTPSH